MDQPMADEKKETGLANILVPRLSAIIQDLGPFLTGHQMHTDILPGSALVCHANDDGPLVDDEGYVFFAFEGNLNGAVNLDKYYEKCLCAADRLKYSYPSIAYGRARIEDVTVVACYDMDRLVFNQVLNREALEAWSGENIESFLPPAFQTPCTDLEVISPLLALPMRPVMVDMQTAAIWTLQNGMLVVKAKNESLCVYSHDDKELRKLVDGLDLDPRFLISIFGPSLP